MQKYVDFSKTYSQGHYNQYRDDSVGVCAYNREVDTIEEFTNNNFTKYGKFIMLEHHKFKKGHNMYHHVFNVETKMDGCLPPNVIKNTAFLPSVFNWGFSYLSRTWKSMIRRCYDPKSDRYNAYGARGIRVCRDWYNPSEDTNHGNWAEKEKFRDWCFYNGYANDPDLEIDRYDNDGNYCPENCQLVSHEYNSLFQTKTNIIHISFAGIIDIFDTEAAWSRFISDNNPSFRLLGPIYLNAKLKYQEVADIARKHDYRYAIHHIPDDIRLNECVYYILQHLPIDFINYCDAVFSQCGICPVIPVYWDRRKPWFDEWNRSYRIS